MQEAITVEGPGGRKCTWTAEVLRHSQANRMTIAMLYALGGFFGATVCIVVPIAHLITTWALPVGGIFMAIRTWKREIVIVGTEGPCPNCEKPIQLSGGSATEPEWQVCPECKARLRFVAASV